MWALSSTWSKTATTVSSATLATTGEQETLFHTFLTNMSLLKKVALLNAQAARLRRLLPSVSWAYNTYIILSCLSFATDIWFFLFDAAAGPGVLDCENGRCTAYTTDDTFDCGNAIEEASAGFGSFQTLHDGDNIVHILHGFEGIDTDIMPIDIPETCTLDCSGCSFTATRRSRLTSGSRAARPELYESWEKVASASTRSGIRWAMIVASLLIWSNA